MEWAVMGKGDLVLKFLGPEEELSDLPGNSRAGSRMSSGRKKKGLRREAMAVK